MVPRILLLAEKPLGEAAFSHLRGRADVELVGVSSRWAAKGAWWGRPRLEEAASAAGLPFVASTGNDQEGIAALLRQVQADVLLSVQHPYVLRPALIDAVGGWAFNLHSAPLPAYGGYDAANHAIIDGAAEFGATLHWMAAEVDAGDVAFSSRFAVEPDETARSLYLKAACDSLRLLGLFVDALVAGTVPRDPLPAPPVVHRRGELEDLRCADDVVDRPDELERRARAFYFPPFEPAYLTAGARRVFLLPSRRELEGFGSLDS